MPIGKPVDQERQVSQSYTYDDARTTGATMESAPTSAQDNLNDARTLLRLITGEADWFTAPASSIVAMLVLIAANITPAEHESLRQLVHFIDSGPTAGFASGAVLVLAPVGDPFPTSATWYVDATLTTKLVEQVVVYGETMSQIITSTWTMYDADGTTPVDVVTDATAFDGLSPFPTSTTRSVA